MNKIEKMVQHQEEMVELCCGERLACFSLALKFEGELGDEAVTSVHLSHRISARQFYIALCRAMESNKGLAAAVIAASENYQEAHPLRENLENILF